jgi:trehalose utilization protein
MTTPIRVTVWNEFRHEKNPNHPASTIYPNGMHTVIAEGLREAGYTVGTATLDEPEHGLTDEVLANTDVLIWWGHMAHGEVSDTVVNKVHERVLEGMGLIVLHSAHFSKIFRKLMGTSCSLRWREADERERIWVIEPGHPIANGLDAYFELPEEEMYGELFDIPTPDDLVLISWFQGGEVFRSGCCFHRGRGKIFYFRPGHESYPTYFDANVRKVIANGVAWAAPSTGPAYPYGGSRAINAKEPLEPLPSKGK